MGAPETLEWILSQTIQLSDNSTGKIFSINKRNKKGNILYNCQLCTVLCMSLECLMIHIAGRKHQNCLTVEAFDAEEFRRDLNDMRLDRFKRKCLELS